MKNPLGAPKIYHINRLNVGLMAIHEDISDPFFKLASQHMKRQVQKAISLSSIWPRYIISWLQRVVVPLEAAYEFGDRTPALRDKMLALNIGKVATRLFKQGSDVKLTFCTRRVNIIRKRKEK